MRGPSLPHLCSVCLAFMEQNTRFRVRGTQTLRRLVFSNSLACMGMWDASTRELSQAFSDVRARMAGRGRRGIDFQRTNR